MYQQPKAQNLKDIDSILSDVDKTSNKEIDKLISDLKIDKTKNKALATKFYKLSDSFNSLKRKVNRLKIWRWLLIIFLIFPFFICTNKIKKITPTLQNQEKEVKELEKQLTDQLFGFVNSFSFSFINEKIIKPTVKDILIVPTMSKQDALDWDENSKIYMSDNSCATDMTSGLMFEHPFVLMNRRRQVWYRHTYIGSLPVTYTTHVNGHSQLQTTVVTATVTKDAPKWIITPMLLYKTSFAPELSFTNNVSSSIFKHLNKKQYDLENRDFNKICKIARNDETKIRVVFTPLAQENFIKLFTDKKYFVSKENNYTEIQQEKDSCNIGYIKIDFSSFDLDVLKQKILRNINSYIRTLLIYSLPIANMPVYYQTPYKTSYKTTKTRYSLQVTSDVNRLVDSGSYSNLFETPVIYDSKAITEINDLKNNKAIIAKVGCYSFHPKHKTVFVPTPSPNGIVEVPVDTIDYLPVEKTLYYSKFITGSNFAMISSNPISADSIVEKMKTLNK